MFHVANNQGKAISNKILIFPNKLKENNLFYKVRKSIIKTVLKNHLEIYIKVGGYEFV